MKRHLPKINCEELTDMPTAFVACESDTFVVKHKVTGDDIVDAAQSILQYQLKTFPLVLNNLKLVKQLAIFKLSRLKSECFCVMFLDAQHKLICFEKLFQGTIDQVAVHPREIAKRAFELNAESIILVHNYPCGDCRPSANDEWLTVSIKSAFKLMKIEVVDHLIVGGDQAYSFSEQGKL